MSTSLNDRCSTLMQELNLVPSGSVVQAQSLSGGVASDIAMVACGDRKYCVKFALPKLKVAADWFAPVHRSAAEYAWLQVAARIAPRSAVKLFGRSEAHHGFVMEFLDGGDIYLWKAALLDQAPDRGEAAKVGDLLGQIHAASVQPGFDVAPFQNRDDFRALRIEPYLSYVAEQGGDLAADLNEMAAVLYDSQTVLVHGDVSPKNILFRDGNAIILDAECATIGDASFDPAFCLNHLVLKAVHLPAVRERYLLNALDFWKAYAARCDWEPVAKLEARICRLLPMLALARVDGKSPVEYLTPEEKGVVRKVAVSLIRFPATTLEDFLSRIKAAIEETTP